MVCIKCEDGSRPSLGVLFALSVCYEACLIAWCSGMTFLFGRYTSLGVLFFSVSCGHQVLY